MPSSQPLLLECMKMLYWLLLVKGESGAVLAGFRLAAPPCSSSSRACIRTLRTDDGKHRVDSLQLLQRTAVAGVHSFGDARLDRGISRLRTVASWPDRLEGAAPAPPASCAGPALTVLATPVLACCARLPLHVCSSPPVLWRLLKCPEPD